MKDTKKKVEKYITKKGLHDGGKKAKSLRRCAKFQAQSPKWKGKKFEEYCVFYNTNIAKTKATKIPSFTMRDIAKGNF